jgi:glycosyltransferase involved in cell wall biosynthesis
MAEPLRILNISLGGGRAGSGIFAIGLAKKLNQLGHQVIQACSSNSFTLSCAKNENLPVHLIDIHGLFEFEKARELAKYVKENKIQIMNTHHSGERYLAIFAKLLYGCKAKIVITRHAVSGTVPFFGTLIYNIGSDMNIAVSRVVYESLKNDLTWKKKILYGGINIDPFKKPADALIERLKEKHGLTDRRIPVIGMVADFDPNGKNTRGHGKGHSVLFEAVSLLKEKVVLLLIGPDSESCRSLLDLAISRGLSKEQVVIIPFQENIAPFYYLMDMHILPSFSESLGLVTLEAMAAGIPCIGTDIGGINEIILHGVNGLLFKKGDPADLTVQIKTLLNNLSLKKELAEKGRENVASFFNMERVARETSDLFYELLEK